jgi:hypothetical protein
MGAAAALTQFVADLPKPRLVWRQVQELASRQARTALSMITPETARAWLARKVSPAEPDQHTAKRYAG